MKLLFFDLETTGIKYWRSASHLQRVQGTDTSLSSHARGVR